MYEVGGYKLPFLVLGGTLLSTGVWLICIIPETKEQVRASDSQLTFWEMIKVKRDLVIK